MASVTKDTMDCYRIQSNGEWATICVREWTVPAAGRESGVRHVGEILIYSAFGSWAYQWGAMGKPLAQFLARTSRDYVFTKFMGDGYHAYDEEGTLAALKRGIVQTRRHIARGFGRTYRMKPTLDKTTARAIWSAVDEDMGDSYSADAFVSSMYDLQRGFEPYGTYETEGIDRDAACQFFDEPWRFKATKPHPQAVGFWQEIWPHFIKQLSADAADKTSAATAPQPEITAA